MYPKPIAKMWTVWPGIQRRQVCWPHAVTMEKLQSGATNLMVSVESECSLWALHWLHNAHRFTCSMMHRAHCCPLLLVVHLLCWNVRICLFLVSAFWAYFTLTQTFFFQLLSCITHLQVSVVSVSENTYWKGFFVCLGGFFMIGKTSQKHIFENFQKGMFCKNKKIVYED